MRFLIALLLLLTLPSAGFSQARSKAKPGSSYQKNLGNVGIGFLGTVGQCKQILRMMKEKPGHNVYAIAYRDAVGARSFSVNLKAATITRNQIGGGFGFRRKTETWSGDVMGRLKRGAADSISSLGDDYREVKQ